MNLFNSESFVSHSGTTLSWKIDCDALTDEDISTLAVVISSKIGFKKVIGIPNGGIRLANELTKYCKSYSDYTLIVDDVLTTGRSMEEAKREFPEEDNPYIIGVVMFARSYCPYWIYPVFSLKGTFRGK